MTIANVTKTNSSQTGVDPSWTHTPVGGDPNGVLVFIVQPFTGRLVSAVTYGGVSMVEVSGSPNEKTATEQAVVSVWFLGSGIPTGAQTVQVTALARDRAVASYSVTASGDMEVQDTDIISLDSQANPSGTLSLGGSNAFCAMGFFSGRSAVGQVTPLTNWTDDIEFDFGSAVECVYSYDIIDSVDVTAGWTQGADDAVSISAAIKEIAAAAVGDLLLTNRSISNYQGIRQ